MSPHSGPCLVCMRAPTLCTHTCMHLCDPPSKHWLLAVDLRFTINCISLRVYWNACYVLVIHYTITLLGGLYKIVRLLLPLWSPCAINVDMTTITTSISLAKYVPRNLWTTFSHVNTCEGVTLYCIKCRKCTLYHLLMCSCVVTPSQMFCKLLAY